MLRIQNESTRAAFDERAQRAEFLASHSRSGAEALRFVGGLFRTQSRVAEALEALHVRSRLCGRLAVDAPRMLVSLLEIPRFAAHAGPPPLAAESLARISESVEIARTRLDVYWRDPRPPNEDYLSRAMLRPWAATLRAFGITPEREHRASHCPFCGGAPIVGCRRGGTGSEGAARSLICSQCALEWSYNRIRCPACGEEDPQRLPVFANETQPCARIEACETCARYLKTLDLSLDARPIPEVDDLASIALDLWAREHGFTRIERGLAGV